MTLFHFGNCVILAYAPYFIAYKYSSLSDYTSIWKCAQASLVYFLTQFLKMMTVATFFPASDLDAFQMTSVGVFLCVEKDSRYQSHSIPYFDEYLDKWRTLVLGVFYSYLPKV